MKRSDFHEIFLKSLIWFGEEMQTWRVVVAVAIKLYAMFVFF